MRGYGRGSYSGTVPFKPSTFAILDRESRLLDSLIAELSAGVRNQRHLEELEEQAEGVGMRIRNAFREGRI